MTAATHDFTIEQGATLRKEFVWKDSAGDPITLDNTTARSQLRHTIGDPVVADSLTTENGRIEIDANEGKTTLIFPPDVSADYTQKKYVYDVELDRNGEVIRLVQGTITISREVTRDD